MNDIHSEHELDAEDPRRHPSSNLDDDRGGSDEAYDLEDDEDNLDSDMISDDGSEDDGEDAPSSNERRGYGHVPRQR